MRRIILFLPLCSVTSTTLGESCVRASNLVIPSSSMMPESSFNWS